MSCTGSSPLTRGKPRLTTSEHEVCRLIPAHAGKTSALLYLNSASRAHPRSRGENIGRKKNSRKLRGSSPLTRGKPVVGSGDGVGVGLIPAHAGKTTSRRLQASAPRAHPRSRGENSPRYSGAAPAAGSSPLTRGKQNTMTTYRRKGRLIPAHAGKTNKYGARLSRTTAHPRSRGENPGSGMPSWFRSGSSPLTRGKRRQLNPMRAASRLIPAHAGKTPQD